jgi:hypothetical protein
VVVTWINTNPNPVLKRTRRWCIVNSSRHKRIARLRAREDTGIERVARLGTWEVALVLARDDSVLVDTFGGSTHHGLEVLAEVGRLEIRVQLGGQMVAEIPGVLGVVVAANAP